MSVRWPGIRQSFETTIRPSEDEYAFRAVMVPARSLDADLLAGYEVDVSRSIDRVQSLGVSLVDQVRDPRALPDLLFDMLARPEEWDGSGWPSTTASLRRVVA
jgi:hypothetical protein